MMKLIFHLPCKSPFSQCFIIPSPHTSHLNLNFVPCLISQIFPPWRIPDPMHTRHQLEFLATRSSTSNPFATTLPMLYNSRWSKKNHYQPRRSGWSIFWSRIGLKPPPSYFMWLTRVDPKPDEVGTGPGKGRRPLYRYWRPMKPIFTCNL